MTFTQFENNAGRMKHRSKRHKGNLAQGTSAQQHQQASQPAKKQTPSHKIKTGADDQKRYEELNFTLRIFSAWCLKVNSQSSISEWPSFALGCFSSAPISFSRLRKRNANC